MIINIHLDLYSECRYCKVDYIEWAFPIPEGENYFQLTLEPSFVIKQITQKNNGVNSFRRVC